MITKIISIGNSKGIRLPMYLLKQLNMDSKVEIISNKNEIILRPVNSPRAGWNEAFKDMVKNADDNLLIDDSLDFDEWEW